MIEDKKLGCGWESWGELWGQGPDELQTKAAEECRAGTGQGPRYLLGRRVASQHASEEVVRLAPSCRRDRSHSGSKSAFGKLRKWFKKLHLLLRTCSNNCF